MSKIDPGNLAIYTAAGLLGRFMMVARAAATRAWPPSGLGGERRLIGEKHKEEAVTTSSLQRKPGSRPGCRGRITRHAGLGFIVAGVLALSTTGLILVGCQGKQDARREAPAGESAPAKAQSPASRGEGAQPGPAGQAETPAAIRASHILVAYQGAMRATATRTREEARARAEEVLGKARAEGSDFAGLAMEYSDDPTAQMNQGDLNFFSRGQMVAEFDRAAFALKVGEISGIVETPFGFHIIKRTM